MIIFFYLTFGHFLADFVLQPTDMVRWKSHDRRGTAIHSLVHFLMYLAVLPMLCFENPQVALVFLGLAISHFFIDNLKIHHEKHGKRFVRYFIADQMAHLGLIGLASVWITSFRDLVAPASGFAGYMYGHVEVPIGLTLLILVTSVVEIFKYQSLREKKAGARFHPNYRQMAYRGAVFTLIYSIFLIMGVYNAAAMG